MASSVQAPDRAPSQLTVMICSDRSQAAKLEGATHLWLFLDYDGTLAEFAPTPDVVTPDPELIELISRLCNQPAFRLTIVSGRRLHHIRVLVPILGLWLAGTYGIELLSPEGIQINRLEYASIRPALEQIKPRWENIITNNADFYLEDKGWSLALHAKFATDDDAAQVLSSARAQARSTLSTTDLHFLGGHKFLEVIPASIDKGKTIQHLLDFDPFPDALPIYVGDDDKDEKAFSAIKMNGGLGILVAEQARKTEADCRLESPQAVRQWLDSLIAHHSNLS